MRVLSRLSGQLLAFPFYHTVSDEQPAHLKHLYKVKTIREFRSDLDFLLKRFEPVHPEILISDAWKKPISKPSFILSFDDGLSEVYHIIAPILREKGVPAVFFLNNDFIGNHKLFYRCKASLLAEKVSTLNNLRTMLREMNGNSPVSPSRYGELDRIVMKFGFHEENKLDMLAGLLGVDFTKYLQENQPYMSHEMVADLLQQGFMIGAHGSEHVHFNMLEPDKQLEELCRSMDGIQLTYKLNYRFFAFPFTDEGLSPRFFNQVYNKEKPLIDAGFGTSGIKKQNHFPHFQRVSMEKPAYSAKELLKTAYFYYLLKKMAGRHKDRRFDF